MNPGDRMAVDWGTIRAASSIRTGVGHKTGDHTAKEPCSRNESPECHRGVLRGPQTTTVNDHKSNCFFCDALADFGRPLWTRGMSQSRSEYDMNAKTSNCLIRTMYNAKVPRQIARGGERGVNQHSELAPLPGSAVAA